MMEPIAGGIYKGAKCGCVYASEKGRSQTWQWAGNKVWGFEKLLKNRRYSRCRKGKEQFRPV